MIVSWMTTNQCNLKCSHCYQDAGERKAEELSTQAAKKMIDEIALAGFRIMIFSGGEPLMRPDIFELVAHAAKNGLRPVFGTNGMLITPEVAAKLKACGAAAMGISLDSLDPAKHNQFRGDADAFRLTVEGMENCRKADLQFQVHTTVLNWNQHEICDITDFAIAKGAVNHSLFFLIPVGRGKYIEDTSLEVLATEELLKQLMAKQKQVSIDIKPTCAPQFTRIAQQMDIKTRYTRGCLAGLTYCIVSPTGKVRPCAYMLEEAGDLKDTPFNEIWANSALFKDLRQATYGGSCGKCDFKDLCGGCRARAAYYNSGDFMAEDSYCAYGKKLI